MALRPAVYVSTSADTARFDVIERVVEELGFKSITGVDGESEGGALIEGCQGFLGVYGEVELTEWEQFESETARSLPQIYVVFGPRSSLSALALRNRVAPFALAIEEVKSVEELEATLRRLVPRFRGDPRASAPAKAELSPSSRAALRLAEALRVQKSSHGTSEMILFGLLDKHEDAAATFLAAAGVEPLAASMELAQRFGWSLPVGLAPDAPASLSQPTGNAARILGRAAELATNGTIRARHLFAAILDARDSQACGWVAEKLAPAISLETARRVLAEWSPDEEFTVEAVNRRVDVYRASAARQAFSDSAAGADLLDFDKQAAALAEIILKPETRPPVVIGVYGPWGSGKSTFLKLVKRDLEDRDRQTTGDKPTLVPLEYNAWAYTDAAKLWTGLVQQVSKKLDEKLTPMQRLRYALAKRSLKIITAVLGALIVVGTGLAVRYLQNDSLLWKLLSGFGVGLLGWLGLVPRLRSIEGTVEGLTRGFNPDELSSVMSRVREELQSVVERYFIVKPPRDSDPRDYVRQGKIKVVVFIDELDRCPLHRIVDILEAIKLFLAEEIFIVLLAVDTRVAAEAIHLHYKEVATPQLAREYLEKIVQIPIPVPKPRPGDVTALLRDLMKPQAAAPEKPADARAARIERPLPQPLATTVSEETFAPAPAAAKAAAWTPRELPDTEAEVETLSALGSQFLDGNPRRLKRVLNTYRYVKLLEQRRGRPAHEPEWQRRMLAWLVFTQTWPEFMAHAIQAARARARSLVPSLDDFTGADRPSADAVVKYLPLDAGELIGLATDASNFLIENPERAHAAAAVEPVKPPPASLARNA